MALRVAEALVQLGRRSVGERGQFLLALNGGGTPERLFRLLGTAPYSTPPFWRRTVFFWGDERAVPPDQPGSSYKQAAELFLDDMRLDAGQIQRIEGELEAAVAAAAYAKTLKQFALPGQAWPTFDLVLLGMGKDGHTASLFPGVRPENEQQGVIAAEADYEGRPAARITLTPEVFNRARQVFWMVTGKEKAAVVADVLLGPHLPERYPAQRIEPEKGESVWWLDAEAAADLKNTS